MPVVTHTVKEPGGRTPRIGKVTITLVAAASGNAQGHDTAADESIGGQWEFRLSGDSWTETLKANSLITPANTVYKVVEVLDGVTYTHHISVPNGAGPYRLEDILVDPPGDLASSALGLHLADTTDVHGIADTAALVTQAGGNIATGTGPFRDVGTNDSSKGYEFLRLKFDSGIRGLGRDGLTDYHLLRMARWDGIGTTQNFAILGDSRMDWLSVPCDLDLVQKNVIDVKRVGNLLALTDTWLVQGLSPSGGGAGYFVGIQTKSDQDQYVTRLVCNNAAAVANSYVKVVNSSFQMADTQNDTNPRLQISNGGNIIELGAGGASALDIKISRGGADLLKIDDQVLVSRPTSGLSAFSAQIDGDSGPRASLSSSGVLAFGPGNAAVDMTISRPGLGRLRCNTKFIADAGLGCGNSLAATTLGSVTRKMEVFDTSGTSLGFVPIYNAIT